MADAGRLALEGGPKVIADGVIKKWPPIDDIDREYVLASLAGTKHAFGPNCVAFQEEFAAWNGNRFAVATNSGTAALHMGIAACGCGTGDEVIVTAYSWSSSATCILHHNALPVFVDIDYGTMNIDTAKIEAAITPRTKAIMVVHLHGLAVNMDQVLAVARKHRLKVIEDACQAHGAEFRGRRVGRWGDCAAFSFNQNKCLCTGEGGMFVTDNEEIAEKAKMLWSFGETRTPVEDRDYHAYALGWMYRQADLIGAFGRAQLTKMDRYLAIQEENAAVLLEKLKDIPGLVLPFAPAGHRHNWYNFTVRLDAARHGWEGREAAFRDAVMDALKAEGVACSLWQKFILPAMTVFQAQNAYGRGCPWNCPNAQPVAYDCDAYPAARKHCENHIGMTMPLRAPNGPEVAALVGDAYRKVFDNIDRLPVAG